MKCNKKQKQKEFRIEGDEKEKNGEGETTARDEDAMRWKNEMSMQETKEKNESNPWLIRFSCKLSNDLVAS